MYLLFVLKPLVENKKYKKNSTIGIESHEFVIYMQTLYGYGLSFYLCGYYFPHCPVKHIKW